MQVTFYKNTSDNRVVNKSLATLKSDLIIQNQPIDRAKPIFKVVYDENLLTSNYCYIDVFQRYYYINTVETQGQMLNVICDKCDVLMSYKDYLYNLNCTCKRQSNLFNTYLNDEEYQVYSNSNIVLKVFPNSIRQEECLLLVITGGI